MSISHNCLAISKYPSSYSLEKTCEKSRETNPYELANEAKELNPSITPVAMQSRIAQPLQKKAKKANCLFSLLL